MCNLIQQIMIVEFQVKTACQAGGDLVSSAAELTANGDDSMHHSSPPIHLSGPAPPNHLRKRSLGPCALDASNSTWALFFSIYHGQCEKSLCKQHVLLKCICIPADAQPDPACGSACRMAPVDGVFADMGISSAGRAGHPREIAFSSPFVCLFCTLTFF